MCAECTFIEEDTPMIFDDTPEERPNLLNQSCCGNCQCGK